MTNHTCFKGGEPWCLVCNPATIAIPAAALSALRRRISTCPYEADDDWDVIGFINEVDEYLGSDA